MNEIDVSEGLEVILLEEETDEYITTVRFSPDEAKRVLEAAEAEGVSLEEFFIMALKDGLNNK